MQNGSNAAAAGQNIILRPNPEILQPVAIYLRNPAENIRPNIFVRVFQILRYQNRDDGAKKPITQEIATGTLAKIGVKQTELIELKATASPKLPGAKVDPPSKDAPAKDDPALRTLPSPHHGLIIEVQDGKNAKTQTYITVAIKPTDATVERAPSGAAGGGAVAELNRRGWPPVRSRTRAQGACPPKR